MAQITQAGRGAIDGSLADRPRPRAHARRVIDRIGRDNVIRILTFIGLMLLWEGISRVVRPIIFTSPARAADAFSKMVRDGSLVEAWQETLFVLVAGLVISAILGVTLGILLGRYRTASDLLEPELNALFMTPRIALLPIITLWLGFGDPSKILVVFLFSFFEIFFTVRNGVRTIDAEYVEVSRAYCVSERTMLQKVVLPAAVPFIVTGLRLGLLHGMVGVVLAGFFLENNGIGGLIFDAGTNFRVPALFAALLTVMLVGVLINQTLRTLERRVAPWRIGAGL
jgi:sulfonate transport system permease protein